MEDEDWTLVAAQKGVIAGLMDKSPAKGETWYLVDHRWLTQWKKYVGYDHSDTGVIGEPSANPGPIDNSCLLEVDMRTLRKNLIEEIDYTAVPLEAWNKLISWYELSLGQESLGFRVIEQGIFVKRCKVEIYLLELRLSNGFCEDNIVKKSFSREATVESLAVTMRNVFLISQERNIRLWFKYMSNSFDLVNKWNVTLQDACLYPGQLIVIEVEQNDGTYKRPIRPVSNVTTTYTMKPAVRSTTPAVKTGHKRPLESIQRILNYSQTNDSSSGLGFGNPPTVRYEPGLCGLTNIGNTCFMNSALQCMSNVPSLTEYMLSDRWNQELNSSNPMGAGGLIARTYAGLIKSMWSGNITFTTPKDFKAAVGKFKNEFAGLLQQDAHELLAVLLDGLHEDLNRIIDKPYFELKEANGRPDKEVASEVWTDYIKRNDSVIVDTFHGLLKSTVVCPQCERVSVKFDPFGYLSLPLPSPLKAERQITTVLVPSNPWSRLRRFSVSVPKTGAVADLCIALSKMAGINPEMMVVVEVYNNHFNRVFMPEERVSHIKDYDDIFVYEVPVDDSDDLLLIPVYMREERAPSDLLGQEANKLFGPPCLLTVRKSRCTYDFLYKSILNRMARYVGVMDIATDSWKSIANLERRVSDKDRMDDAGPDGDDANDDPDSKSQSEELMDYKDGDGVSNYKPCVTAFKLFTLHGVNSYGNAELAFIQDNGKPITFLKYPYVVASWKAKTKQQFYDEARALDFDDDESYVTRALKKDGIELTDCLELFTSQERLGAHSNMHFLCPLLKT